MEHATAWRHPRHPLFRNYYAAEPGRPALESLCERGLMRMYRKPSEDCGGLAFYTVTEAGLNVLRTPAPEPEGRERG